MSPVCYADRLGALHRRLVAAHGVQLDAVDREILAGGACTWCSARAATATWAWASPTCRRCWPSGVRLALGTDSLVSAETLDVLDDAALLHRQFPALDPGAIVRMATLGGAQALGLDDLGAIAPGKRAALAFAPASGVETDPHELRRRGVPARAGGGPMTSVLARTLAPTDG